jgi:DNA-binding XRE family transcriptional regulator
VNPPSQREMASELGVFKGAIYNIINKITENVQKCYNIIELHKLKSTLRYLGIFIETEMQPVDKLYFG